MLKVALIYFTQTDVTGQLVRAAAEELKNLGAEVVSFLVSGADLDHGRFSEPALMAQLNDCDAIIFGSPTYMGGVAAQFKAFADATSDFWENQLWVDKVAAGITSGSAVNGDQSVTLHYLVTLASQHGMIWVGLDGITGDDSSRNRLGCNLGVTAHSPDGKVHEADLISARYLAKRVAKIAGQLKSS